MKIFQRTARCAANRLAHVRSRSAWGPRLFSVYFRLAHGDGGIDISTPVRGAMSFAAAMSGWMSPSVLAFIGSTSSEQCRMWLSGMSTDVHHCRQQRQCGRRCRILARPSSVMGRLLMARGTAGKVLARSALQIYIYTSLMLLC